MKRLVKRISLPLLLLVGLTLIGPQTAEAAKWRRYARRAYVHRPYYAAPPAVYAPRVRVYASPVRVYAPGVGVHVGLGVHVRAPGVRINVGSWYPSHYGRPYYYGW
ncbi:MAG: hypothetical protein ACYTG0_39705 [Planctomycetota bacterium]